MCRLTSLIQSLQLYALCWTHPVIDVENAVVSSSDFFTFWDLRHSRNMTRGFHQRSSPPGPVSVRFNGDLMGTRAQSGTCPK